jgi:myo-inositol-1(or 4)-monophosphatase
MIKDTHNTRIKDMHDFSAIAINAVKEGVEILLSSEQADGRIFSELGKDIKLEADLLLSRELTSRLTDKTGIPCLSEEDVSLNGDLPEGDVWIVDPLDGSMNFARGIPLYCISIALCHQGTPVFGLIHDIERGVTLSGSGDTAYAIGPSSKLTAGKTMHVRTNNKMEKAVLATGLPLLTDTSPKALGWFLKLADRFKKVRMLGSAALSLAWVADGRLDAYYERDIMLWDVAAGAALVSAAGGVCLMRQGKTPLSREVIAANKDLASAMEDLLEC